MTRRILGVIVCATLVWVRPAVAAPTPQQKCDYERITAWKKYASCVQGVVAKDTSPGVDGWPYIKCRHLYFKKWVGFQNKASLAGSTCQPLGGARFTDNGDQTVFDNLTGLTWEKKDNFDNSVNLADPHDADNFYTWSTGAPYKEDGTLFTVFLAALNDQGFAGSNGWRLPTMVELQTITLYFPCKGRYPESTCLCLTAGACIDPALDASNTHPDSHATATGWHRDAKFVWSVSFYSPAPYPGVGGKKSIYNARAVRGGF